MVNLHDAADKGNLENVREFLSRYAAKVNQTNRDGQTALHLASKGGHVEVCKELIASVAFVDVEDKTHKTPLCVAVENNRARVARALCEAGASTSLPNPVDRRTPLHVAAKMGFVECAEVLVQHGAVIDGNPDKWGHLPDEDCATADIRILIETTRRERATAGTCCYDQVTPTAPPPEGYTHYAEGAGFYSHGGARDHAAIGAAENASHLPWDRDLPSYQEICGGKSKGGSHFAAATGGSVCDTGTLSPSTQARKAAALGGDRCAGCNASERSRQLTPCHHIVCKSCTSRARDEEGRGCPACHSLVFDDNPLFDTSEV